MRALGAFILVPAVLLLLGCDLFGKLEQESSLSSDIADACDQYCQGWVAATVHCEELAGCVVHDVNNLIEFCTGECIDSANALDEDKAWEVVDCMWCVIDDVGTDPDCAEFEPSHLGDCLDLCGGNEVFYVGFSWFEYMNSECYGDW
jgi:hypothetical protein